MTRGGAFSASGVISSGCSSSRRRSKTARPIPSADASLLEWLLELSDSVLTYRVRYVQRPEWQSVVDLIVLDARNPRSAHFQLTKLAKHVRLLPNAETGDLPGEVDRLIATCRGAEEWRGEGHGPARDRTIEPLLLGVERLAARLSDALTLRYFSHVDDQPRVTVAV